MHVKFSMKELVNSMKDSINVFRRLIYHLSATLARLCLKNLYKLAF